MAAEREKFKALAKDMLPVINDMEAVLKKHNVKCLASITMSAGGYFNFSTHNTDWELRRPDFSDKIMISCTLVEEL